MFEKAKRIGKKIVIYFFVFSLFSVLLLRFVPVYFTPLIFIRLVEQIIEGKPLTAMKTWVPMESISPKAGLAVVCSEDQLFLSHHGFDTEAIKKAFSTNKKKRKIRGASTISQQTAKNVFLWPSRSWIRKGFEVYFTFLIELFWSKERILEVYLNVIEMGDGIYGIEAAAQHYFRVSAANLSASQAAMIAATLPNPRKMNAARSTPFLRNRQTWIMRQMGNQGGEIDFQ